VLEQDNRQLSAAEELRSQSQRAPGVSTKFGELIAVVGLWGDDQL
jgi:hypothetical protein